MSNYTQQCRLCEKDMDGTGEDVHDACKIAEARIAVVGAWLARFNDIFPTWGKGLEKRPRIFDEFDEALKDLPLDQLESACQEWRRIGTHFPTPGHIRGIITKRIEAEDQYASEKAWHEIRWRIDFFNWSPTGGFMPLFIGAESRLTDRVAEATTKTEYNGGWLLRPKPQDARTQHAIDAVGGLQRIADARIGNEFDWTRRGFLEAHRRYSLTSGYTQIGRSEAAGLIEGLRKELK